MTDWLAVIVVLLVGVASVRDRLRPDPDPVREIRAAYARGEIDERELERRLGPAVDPRVEEIRAIVEPVPDVGLETAKAIAAHFETREAVEDATREELMDVHGIGLSTADALRKRFER